ncbi:hypothetical protein [Polaribacter sp.]
MGIIRDSKKFERKKTQNHPTNPGGDLDQKNKDFSLDKENIVEQKEK